MHRLTPKFKFFIRNLCATKMQSFIKLGRKIIVLKILLRHCDLKGHPRSKVKVLNESPVMTSYLKLIVTVCLSGTNFKILAVLTTCSLS